MADSEALLKKRRALLERVREHVRKKEHPRDVEARAPLLRLLERILLLAPAELPVGEATRTLLDNVDPEECDEFAISYERVRDTDGRVSLIAIATDVARRASALDPAAYDALLLAALTAWQQPEPVA